MPATQLGRVEHDPETATLLSAVPVLLIHFGCQWVWIIAGIGALATAPILLICRGSWGRFTLPEVQPLDGVEVSPPVQS